MDTVLLNTLLLTGKLSGIFDGLLSTVAIIGGALVAIALIISIVKDAMGYIKGSGSNSIGKIIGKVLLLIVMIGIIAVAGSMKNGSGGFMGLGKTAAEKAEHVVDAGLDELQ